jgi:hypothetical protein
MEKQRVRIPRALTIYFVATGALWTVVLFTGRCWVLSRRSRVILAICGLVGLLTDPMLLILLLMPEIH